jgi:hypothetical protein
MVKGQAPKKAAKASKRWKVAVDWMKYHIGKEMSA